MNEETQKVFNIIAEVISEETNQPIESINWDTIIPKDESIRKKIVERLTVFLRNTVLTGKYSRIRELVLGISFWKKDL